MKREDLKVGGRYTHTNDDLYEPCEVLFIGSQNLFGKWVDDMGNENNDDYPIDHFLDSYKPIPVEPELFFHWEYVPHSKAGGFRLVGPRLDKKGLDIYNQSQLNDWKNLPAKRILKSLGAVDKDGRYYEYDKDSKSWVLDE